MSVTPVQSLLNANLFTVTLDIQRKNASTKDEDITDAEWLMHEPSFTANGSTGTLKIGDDRRQIDIDKRLMASKVDQSKIDEYYFLDTFRHTFSKMIRKRRFRVTEAVVADAEASGGVVQLTSAEFLAALIDKQATVDGF